MTIDSVRSVDRLAAKGPRLCTTVLRLALSLSLFFALVLFTCASRAETSVKIGELKSWIQPVQSLPWWQRIHEVQSHAETAPESERLSEVVFLLERGRQAEREVIRLLELILKDELNGREPISPARRQELAAAARIRADLSMHDDPTSAILLYRRAAELDSGKLGDLIAVGVAAIALERLDHATEALQLARVRLRETSDRLSEANLLQTLSMVEAGRGEVQNALAFSQEALTLYRDIGESKGLARQLLTHAVFFVMSGEVDGAEAAARESLEMFETLQDREGVAKLSAMLGSLHLSRRELTEATLALRKAIGLYEDLQRPAEAAEQYFVLGAAYFAQKSNHLAIPAFEQAVAAAREGGNQAAEAKAQRALAWIYLGEGRTARAQEALSGAEPLSVDPKDRQDVAKLHLKIGQLAIRDGANAAACKHLLKAEALADQVSAVQLASLARAEMIKAKCEG